MFAGGSRLRGSCGHWDSRTTCPYPAAQEIMDVWQKALHMNVDFLPSKPQSTIPKQKNDRSPRMKEFNLQLSRLAVLLMFALLAPYVHA